MPPLLSLEGCASLLYKCKQRVSRTHALSLLACMLGSGLYVHHSVGGNHLLTLLLDTKHCLQPARHLFSRLPHRDKSSWNMIIIGHSNHSHSRELLSLYKHIPTEEFPNICSSAFVSLLKVCIELKDIDAGSEIHSHIAATGLHATDVYVGSALINMYAKCGSVLQAEEVFKCLSIRNIVSWNALITAYIDHGFTQKAINCFEKMQHEGVYPDTVTLICMLKACDGTELASRGYELHMEISQRGLDRDLHIGSSLVHMYAKAGSLDDARKVFHGIAVRDVTLWTSLMMGYADDGKHEEAINCYKKMQSEQISPNSVTYPCILKACSIMREIGQGQLIHKDIEIKGEKNTTVGNALINLYASCLLLAEAEHVFNTLQEWDQVSWNVLIGAFSNQGYPIEAIQYFFQMLIMGYSPDAVTFMYILKACSNLACSHGRTIHAEMVKRGMECELLSSSSLIDFYASHGLLKEAQDTFDKLSDIDVVSWTVLIAGYVDHGLGEHALESFDCMRLKSFSPAPVTLESCLKASASLGAMTKVHEFHAEITRRGWQKGVIIESSLVDSYAKCGCMLEAQSVFDKASCRNVVTWSALIAGYAQNGAIQNVVCTLKNMFLEGMQPNSVTISSILSACSHAGALEEAHVFYETLKDHYNFSEHITCMLDFFCRAGQFESAITLLDQMPFYPCSMVWRNIVGACQKQGNVELGMHVIEHAIHIDKVDFDWGFQDGRQWGRGRSGGQVRDEYRTDYDPGRGGYGKIVQRELESRRQLVDYAGNLGTYYNSSGAHDDHRSSHRSSRDSGRKRHRGDDDYRSDRYRESNRESRPEKNPRFRERHDSDEEESSKR